MIITRTPFRVSLAGGGTDHPAWYLAHGGAVVGFALAKYCYLSVRRLPPYFPDYKHRIVYSRIELARSTADVEHPAVRAVLADQGVTDGIELHYDADVPSRSGLGSSSAFTVGLLHAVRALRGQRVDRHELAREAIRIEQRVIGESVGDQDQTFAAHGGLNRIDLDATETRVRRLVTPHAAALTAHLMLFFTGLQRTAEAIEAQKVRDLEDHAVHLHRMRDQVDEVEAAIYAADWRGLGQLLDEGWRLKRQLATGVSSCGLDQMYEAGLAAGAWGGKLLGAGGGGFLLFAVRDGAREAVRRSLAGLIEVPVAIDRDGSQVVLYEPEL